MPKDCPTTHSLTPPYRMAADLSSGLSHQATPQARRTTRHHCSYLPAHKNKDPSQPQTGPNYSFHCSFPNWIPYAGGFISTTPLDSPKPTVMAHTEHCNPPSYMLAVCSLAIVSRLCLAKQPNRSLFRGLLTCNSQPVHSSLQACVTYPNPSRPPAFPDEQAHVYPLLTSQQHSV